MIAVTSPRISCQDSVCSTRVATIASDRRMSAVPRHLGDYVLGPLIGSGGMSEVYAARHRPSGDEVAIKLLRSHLASDAGAIRAFAGEAERTRAIVHPNVVEV